MGKRLEVHGFFVAICAGALARVVAETVFDSDDDPVGGEGWLVMLGRSKAV